MTKYVVKITRCISRRGVKENPFILHDLTTTEFLHKRIRMIVASFHSNHFLIDCFLEEGYLVEQLPDFDLARN
jgi:hypothetical protein